MLGKTISRIIRKVSMLRFNIRISKKTTAYIFCAIALITTVVILFAAFSSSIEGIQKPITDEQQLGNNDDYVNDNFFENKESPVDVFNPNNGANVSVKTIQGGLGVSIVLKNSGEGDAANIDWSITITHGRRDRVLKEISSSVSNLAAGEETTVKTGMFLGLGKITIKVTVNGVETTAKGRQLLIFTRVK